MQQNFVKIPKDLSLIKQKFIFGLTKRQAMCFGIGLAMGIPAFFIIKTVTSNITVAVIALGIFAFPGIACGLFTKNGMYLEEYLKLLISFMRQPRVRTYQSKSPMAMILNQIEYSKLKRKLMAAGVDISEFNNTKKVSIIAKLKIKKQ